MCTQRDELLAWVSPVVFDTNVRSTHQNMPFWHMQLTGASPKPGHFGPNAWTYPLTMKPSRRLPISEILKSSDHNALMIGLHQLPLFAACFFDAPPPPGNA